MENERGYFEQFLREATDQFELVAGRRVWTSIYNNIHPSKKWPSVSMCLLILTILFLVGHYNAPKTSQLNEQENSTQLLAKTGLSSAFELSEQQQPGQPDNHRFSNSLNGISIEKTEYNNDKKDAAPHAGKGKQAQLEPVAQTTQSRLPGPSPYANNKASKANAENTGHAVRSTGKSLGSALVTNTVSGKNGSQRKSDTRRAANKITNTESGVGTVVKSEDSEQSTDLPHSASPRELSAPNIERFQANANQPNLSQDLSNIRTSSTNSNTSVAAEKRAETNKELNNEDKAWMEDFAQYARRKAKPWKGRLEWQAHLTPYLSYRSLRDNTPEKVMAATNSGANPESFNGSLNSLVSQRPSTGIEAGYALKYSLLRNVKLKLGAQLNYQQYVIDAFENHHPIGTSILLSDNETGDVVNVYKTTSLSNRYGVDEVRLKNNSFQFSIPIGLDARLAGNESIQWYAGANIQPAFILSARHYLLSADKRYYIKDNSLLNRAGLYASVETYLSFNRAGYSWQVGPEFRTNLLSTNTRLYNVLERLNGLGIKAGFTKKF
jgi:hypothetical protein